MTYHIIDTEGFTDTCDLPYICDLQPPRFSFYDAAKPMYTSRRNLPPSKIDNSKVSNIFSMHILKYFQLRMHAAQASLRM